LAISLNLVLATSVYLLHEPYELGWDSLSLENLPQFFPQHGVVRLGDVKVYNGQWLTLVSGGITTCLDDEVGMVGG